MEIKLSLNRLMKH